MSKIEKIIFQQLEQGEEIVLATILSHAGSTPRTAGTKMLIWPDRKIAGTIGGGVVEAEVIKAGQEIFRTGNAQIRVFDLTVANKADSIDMICGGRLEVLIERIEANPVNLGVFRRLLNTLRKGKKSLMVAALIQESNDIVKTERALLMADGSIEGALELPTSLSETLIEKFHRERSPAVVRFENRRFLVEPTFVPGTVYLFGAGHVSQKLAVLTAMTDFRTVVLDDREEFANKERFSDAEEIRVLSDFDRAFEGLEIDQESYLVIVTRGHSHDKTVLAQALRTEAGYIGMIGSRRKRDTIYKRLLNEGFTSDDLKRVHSPIGLSIGAETPEEIAISIIAELIEVRSEK